MADNLLFIIDDDRDPKLATDFYNSLRKFHTEEELDIKIVKRSDKKEWVDDSEFYYRAKPVIAKEYITKYELVIGCDADQLCFGRLDHILGSAYDVGTVLNINRADPLFYGHISIHPIAPNEYYNAGLVAIRSEMFLDQWYKLCHSAFFPRLQFREQDLLNLLCHFGTYDVMCFDRYDVVNNYFAWHGLVSKGETAKAILKEGKVIIPKGEDNYPDRDTVLKIFHYAGGGQEAKNYRIHFSEELQSYIEELVK
jgi:hypothetical protein